MNVAKRLSMEAIILAGGLGTRLSQVVKNVPKPMAIVNNKPFLEILIEYWFNQGIRKFIISVGYKKDIIIDYFGNSYKDAVIEYAEEFEQLGTGGGIINASTKLKNKNDFLLLNGDTYFEINLEKFICFHQSKISKLSFSLIKRNVDNRYKPIYLDQTGKVVSYTKNVNSTINVNGGVYLVNQLLLKDLFKIKKRSFSFENDFLDDFIKNRQDIFGYIFNDKFIDIGTPLDYKKVGNFIK